QMVQGLSAAATAVVAFRWRGAALAVALLPATSPAVHAVLPEPDPAGLLDHFSAIATWCYAVGGASPGAGGWQGAPAASCSVRGQ
ncbi:hypothetical protein ACFW6V_29470, partial [Streptomyces sp. NPDC058734]|uniref:hypothetical protein n=1 Tax=Streptomyces sp. NPDC058734 TaxID=3346615 RepID=UPI0036758137